MVLIIMFTSGCVPYSKLNYFNDINELTEPVANPIKSKTISSFDKISIIVLSTDTQTAALLNYTEPGNANNISTRGYIVDETGSINFPFVGKIKIGGLTLLEAGAEISKSISNIITKPEVILNFLDKKISVLGEVATQGTFVINSDFITIYESLALGGGLSQFADRKKVMLLRMENNKLMHYRLDLTNSKIASSPLYYILPNDIIIVEPLRNKSFSFQNSMISTLLATATGILGLYYITRTRSTIP